MAYRIDFSLLATGHIKDLTARQRALVLDAVGRQLKDQPGVETRNRKPMRPNPIASWELRVRDMRVYYDVREEPEQVVLVLGIGIKVRNRVRLGGEEVDFP